MIDTRFRTSCVIFTPLLKIFTKAVFISLCGLTQPLAQVAFMVVLVGIPLGGRSPETCLPYFQHGCVSGVVPTRDSVVSFTLHRLFLVTADASSPYAITPLVVQGILQQTQITAPHLQPLLFVDSQPW